MIRPTSPIVISVASIVRLPTKIYDESILSSSKYNQSLLRDRQHRILNTIDSQTGIRQKTSIVFKIHDRVNTERTDQVCAYRRRSFRRQIRHKPYGLTSSYEEKHSKPELIDNNQIKVENERNIDNNLKIEMKVEPINSSNQDQVVIQTESTQINNINKRRTILPIVCSKCEVSFKTKNQFSTHLIKCQTDTQLKEQVKRRCQTSKEPLLVSLLKQETMLENIQDTRTNSFSNMTIKPSNLSTINDFSTNNSKNNSKVELDKEILDLAITKQRNNPKNSTNKNQSILSSLIPCTICGETNVINDQLVRCSMCHKCYHAFKCLNFENKNILKKIKTYSWECIDCKNCFQCGTVEQDDELLFCDGCDRAYHMDCLNPPLSEPPPGEWFCQLCKSSNNKKIAN